MKCIYCDNKAGGHDFVNWQLVCKKCVNNLYNDGKPLDYAFEVGDAK